MQTKMYKQAGLCNVYAYYTRQNQRRVIESCPGYDDLYIMLQQQIVIIKHLCYGAV